MLMGRSFYRGVQKFLVYLFFFCLFQRNPVYPASGRQTGDSWNGCWSVGWEQTSPRERGFQHAGGFGGSRERVSDQQKVFLSDFQGSRYATNAVIITIVDPVTVPFNHSD